MSCLLDNLYNDIILIVYHLVHRSYLNECIEEINKRLLWDDIDEVYKINPHCGDDSAVPVANWRDEGDDYNEHIFSIWSTCASSRGLLPKHYLS